MRSLILALSVATALMGLASAPPALADNAAVKRTLEEVGLIGTWGLDCEAMASSTGWEEIVVDERGVVQSIEGGDNSIYTYDIVEATRLDERDVRMKFVPVDDDGDDEDDAGENLIVVYRVEADRQMSWSSRLEGGDALITDGLFRDGETRSQWYQRCPKGIPVP